MLAIQRFAREKLDRAERAERVARLVNLRQPDKPAPTEQDWINAARALKCHPAHLLAVLAVESGGAGYNAQGRLILSYDTQVMSRNCSPKHKYDKSHPHLSTRRVIYYRDVPPSERHKHPMGMSQEERWMLLAEAAELDFYGGTCGGAYGMWQISGEGAKSMGFRDPMHMIEVMYEGYDGQWECFLRFCKWKGCTTHLINGNWREFARLYNGAGQVDFYSKALADAANDARKTLA